MADDACDCTVPADAPPADEPTAADRWVDTHPVEDAPLPADVQAIMSQFYAHGAVETLGDFVAATRAAAGHGGIEVADLCHADGDTGHAARVGSDTYDFLCFYDGIVLAQLVDEPVDVRTESPAGTGIDIHATPTGAVETAPEDAVMSLGIAADAVDALGDTPVVEAVYEGICPYVKAFPSRDRYEGWAAGVDAATVGLPVDAGMPIAAALTGVA